MERGLGTRRHLLLAVGFVLLLVFSFVRFAYDFHRLIYPVNDLTPVWVSSKAFVAGENPYGGLDQLQKTWATAGITSAEGCESYDCILSKYPMGYPPTALPITAVFAQFRWYTAVYSYAVGSIVLFVAALLLLAHRFNCPGSNLRRPYFVAFALALAPLHAGIHHSNMNTLVIALILGGVAFMGRRPYVSGILLGISLCLKPQVAFLFFAYPFLRKQWKTALTELSTLAIISASSVLWLSLHHIEIIRSYAESLAQFMPPGGHNSFYSPSPTRYALINIQVLAFQFTHSPVASNVISLTLFTVSAAVASFLIRSRVSSTNEGTGIATISVLTLLPVYQQIYTAAILVFVIFWAIKRWPSARARAALVLMLPLLFPLAAITWQVPLIAGSVERYHLGSYFLWNAFIMPHVVWIELFLFGILVAELVDSPAIVQSRIWGRWHNASALENTLL